MRRLYSLFSSILVVCALAVTPGHAEAQTAGASPNLYAMVPATFTSFASDAMPQDGTKSPALAGVLSWLIFPGVGSYYAGNSGHGTRHVVIGVGTLAVTVVGLVQASDDIVAGVVDEGSFTLAAIGLTAYFVNSIWSIVVAVGDASAHNRGIASLIRPDVRLLASSSAIPYTFARGQNLQVGMQLVQIDF